MRITTIILAVASLFTLTACPTTGGTERPKRDYGPVAMAATHLAGIKYVEKGKTPEDRAKRTENVRAAIVALESVQAEGLTIEAIRPFLERQFSKKPEIMVIVQLALVYAGPDGGTGPINNSILTAAITGLRASIA